MKEPTQNLGRVLNIPQLLLPAINHSNYQDTKISSSFPLMLALKPLVQVHGRRLKTSNANNALMSSQAGKTSSK
jgi:hypothetical protein